MTYYQNPEQRSTDRRNVEPAPEFTGDLPISGSPTSSGDDGLARRDFLKLTGFGLAASILPGCEIPAIELPNSISLTPYIEQPEGIISGRASWFATTCGGCTAGCGMLAKVRDGRPIKLEGNPGHPISDRGLCAVGQAQLVPLYDSQRLAGPTQDGKPVEWKTLDTAIKAELDKIKQKAGKVRLLTGTLTSPTTRAAVATFLAAYPGSAHVSYDPLSVSAILDAHQRTHGARLLPAYDFAAAELIVSIDADFLGTWISPTQFTRGYRAGRDLAAQPPHFSRHVQLEARMSLTGTKADERHVLTPAEQIALVGALAVAVAAEAHQAAPIPTPALAAPWQQVAKELAHALWQARSKSLVLCGINHLGVQVLVNWINHTLGNYEKTLSLSAPSYQQQGDDRALEQLVADIEAGSVAALIISGVNPLYELPVAARLTQALEKVPLIISCCGTRDETAAKARYISPTPHALETWDDAEPLAGRLSLTQPVIPPLRNTRPLIESLAAWRGEPQAAYEQIRAHWKRELFGLQQQHVDFDAFWNQAVHDGHARIDRPALTLSAFAASAVEPLPAAPEVANGRHALVLYPKVAMHAGQHGHNPLLHELPDPISKVVWDNYAALSPTAAEQLALRQGDVVRVTAGDRNIELPVFIQPGQHDRVVAIALGYGRAGTDRFTQVGPSWTEGRPAVAPGQTVGASAAHLQELSGGSLRSSGLAVTLTPTGTRHTLASTQDHHSLVMPPHLAPAGGEVRPFVQATTVSEYRKDPAAGAPHGHHFDANLWPADHQYTGHHWALAIDLSACTGCSACVLACQTENNTPVVGKDEVRRSREMHWIRVDRYYAETAHGTEVVHQPMMCQQCDHAPCETVCPVLATVHSSEGLNQQVYNRCVGTRYCANNCPYKARRFNWFNYAHEDRLQNMQLNPDVTVRMRGVMEKCTFCVQRIQRAKADASGRGTPLADGELQTACQQSCPAQAIVFGDLNDPASAVALARKDPRGYQVLDELGVKPSVGYLRVVRNRAEAQTTHHSSGGKH